MNSRVLNSHWYVILHIWTLLICTNHGYVVNYDLLFYADDFVSMYLDQMMIAVVIQIGDHTGCLVYTNNYFTFSHGILIPNMIARILSYSFYFSLPFIHDLGHLSMCIPTFWSCALTCPTWTHHVHFYAHFKVPIACKVCLWPLLSCCVFR